MTSAYTYGYIDAVMNRECRSIWKDFPRQSQYLKGYLAGEKTGVKFAQGEEQDPLKLAVSCAPLPIDLIEF